SRSQPLETLPETPPSSNPISRPSANIVQRVNRNLGFQSKWAELNGAMGDLGTYIPIVLALTLAKNLNLGTTLIFTDSTDFNIPEIMASGSCSGAILLVLGVTGLMQMVYKFIPLSVVSQNIWEIGSDWDWMEWFWLLFVLEKKNEENHGYHPFSFHHFLVSCSVGFHKKVVNDIKFGPSVMDIVKITGHSWKEGFIKGTIPQLPLSVLNSVITVCKLSSDLFPGREFSATSVSVTVGLLNLVRCWFGAMPCCHGAGGLAGQYKFGGRSGGCVALLGAAKMMLGLVLGTSLVTILHQFPVGILGVLLLFEGTELAMTCRDMNSKQESIVMLICTAVSLVGSSAALGFVCGMLVHVDT
ncbi:hypothetical protein Goshw_004671, partial [Gossypium schwendimanii]|nr:hypothetical protein [Gossypium schwendimanii]